MHNRRHNNVKSVFLFAPPASGFCGIGGRWGRVERRRSLHYQTARTKNILSIRFSRAALFCVGGSDGRLARNVVPKHEDNEGNYGFSIFEAAGLHNVREWLGRVEETPALALPRERANGLIILLQAIHMANRLKQWMECACVCQHSRHPPVRPPPTDMCVYTERIFHIHCWTSSLIARGVGWRLQKCWSFYTQATTSPPPPERERESESRLSVCFFMFSSIFISFPPSPWKINKTEASDSHQSFNNLHSD